MDIINKRRSVRSFLDKEIEKEKIDLLLRAAMQAPSAMNQQPWEFIVVSNRENIKRLKEVSPHAMMLDEARLAIILLINKTNLKSLGMCYQDLSAACENILLEATYLGLGAVWLGISSRIERMNSLSKLYNLKEEIEPFAIVAIGYPKDNNANKYIDRFDQSKVHYEEY